MKRTTDTTLPGGPKTATAFPDVDRRRVLEGLTLVPTKIFFTKGVGSHRDELRSFELALKDAGIEKLNLVHVSSWYDNEMGYSARCVDLVRYVGSRR